MEHTHNHGTSSHPSKTTASFRFVLGILLCDLVESLALLMIVVDQDLRGSQMQGNVYLNLLQRFRSF
jgi:hypothetical protein